ncbi:DUF2543 family protein [Salmonella enterica]|nr:DUF2543 family protein [Salmonella enterica subsp. enterica serovar Senftenberg]EIL1839698.1 DUF2543 family protein [Salmonella enterica]EIL7441932.1 DUF2543 family protein [Salmonella enterica]EIL8155583.1 DUF2543 family protein [Salmonella enterica]EIL8919936.1 DUF2543 family protein [Salmonella enterica]
MATKIGPTVYKLVYEYSHKSAHALNESERDAMAEYFNNLVTRLVGGEAIDADTLLRLAKEYGVDVLRVPEIARFLSEWGRDGE